MHARLFGCRVRASCLHWFPSASLQYAHAWPYTYIMLYMSLLPITLSISEFLLIAGWKGVRGGLSQLIYHIKYQPSSTFSLPLLLNPRVHPLSSLTFFFASLTSFSSPPTIYISISSHLYSFYESFAPPPLFLALPPLIPSHFFSKNPAALSWRFSFLSLLVTTAICLCGPLPSPQRWPTVPIALTHSHIQMCTLPHNHVRSSEVQCACNCERTQWSKTDHNNSFWHLLCEDKKKTQRD